MRTLLLTLSFILFALLPSAYSQTYYSQTIKETGGPTINGAGLPRPTSNGIDSAQAFLDYYNSDSLLYLTAFKGSKTELINKYYVFPTDTSNSFNKKNYFCINYISVAFDTLVVGSTGYNVDTMGSAQLDTVFIPIIQVNHSGRADTLELQITTVNVNGYPQTGTYLLDTMITGTTLGAGNDYTVKTIKWSLNKYLLPATRFAVTVTYHDSTKKDSCWFIYGYGSFTRVCPEEAPITTFASTTNFSTIRSSVKNFKANSFAFWNEYTGFGGYEPTTSGDNVFFPCTVADNNSYHPGIDGANYLQDINIGADVLYQSYLGLPGIHTSGISILQNYPNPFKSFTTISYSLVRSGEVSLKVVDITGREILAENYGSMSSGQHTINLNAANFSAGIYFYSISSSGYTATQKMVVY